MSLLSSKRKRAKLLDILLNTNWSKESQQAAKLLKLHKILLVCDANFLDEKTGQTPLCLAISSPQIIAATQAYIISPAHNAAITTTTSGIATISSSTISGQQFQAPHNHLYQATVSGGGISCPQSASLFDLQCQITTTGPSQLKQTNINELSQSRAPLIERLILLLVKSGAQIDFRNCDGQTPLHVAAMKSNFWALKTLLDLGAPTDYRDINGLTPLYYSILHKANLKVTQLLLKHNRNSSSDAKFVLTNAQQQQQQQAICNQQRLQPSIGITDQHGWQEVHHSCKLGLDAHLEKLLYYGCDINAKISGSGNTPLHVAAINDQLGCAKVLLLRGADETITNNSHQTAHQVAVISNNMDLAEFIAEHNASKVVLFRDRPTNFTGYETRQTSTAAPTVPRQMSIRSNSTNRSSIASSHSSASIAAAQQRAIVQPQHHQVAHMNPLVLDVAQMSTSGSSSTALSNGSTNSSQPQSLLSIGGHHHHHHHHHLHHPNDHQLNGHVNNISPCLSQRSCATSNTTSSSGVCCDNDGNNSAEEMNQQALVATKLSSSFSQQSNITLIAINPNSTETAPANATDGNSGLISNGVSTYCTSNEIENGLHNADDDGDDVGDDDDDNDDDDDLRSSESSSNGLYSLMSEERPLFAGTIVEATGEYQSGDPDHLHLHRGDLIEVLECARELLHGGELPRLANKPMLFGQRQSDGLKGLFPSFCVRRAKHRQQMRQRSAMMDITNASKNSVSQKCETFSNESIEKLASNQIIRGKNIPDSQSMAAINKQQIIIAQDKAGESSAPKLRYQELQVTLSKTNEGFGFVLRGAKVDPSTLASSHVGSQSDKVVIDERLMAANNLMSLQYLDEIEAGSVAYRAGLKRGDFLVAVNHQDVRLSSHEQVVHMIRQSGDQVHLTIASPIQQKDTSPKIQQQQATYSSKTLGRRKPDPPKRDPSTTLTRNQAQRVKSMLVQPLQRTQPFDADKPLPMAPSSESSPMSPTGSLNIMGRSVSTNLSHFSSAQSLSNSNMDTQSISSVSTVSAERQNLSTHQPTPTHSSSSTTTLTTVATMKPKAPPKPNRSQLDQAAYQPAVITTAKRVSQPQLSPTTPPKAVSSLQDSKVAPKAIPVPGPPPPPPPPPPPLPDFSPVTSESQNQKFSHRRESAPSINLPNNLLDRAALLKKRESLAVIGPQNSNAPIPAQFGAVAAACAAAANSRMQRQQQKQQEEQQPPLQQSHPKNQQPQLSQQQSQMQRNLSQQQPKSPQHQSLSQPKQENQVQPSRQDQLQQEHQQKSQCVQQSQLDQRALEESELKVKNQSLNIIDKENKVEPVATQVHCPSEAKSGCPASVVVSNKIKQQARQQMSSTLGRKSSAQIIQQPKQHQQHSQTLKVTNKPKRPGIPSYEDLPPPPPPLLDESSERTSIQGPLQSNAMQANHSNYHQQNHHTEQQAARNPEIIKMAPKRQESIQPQPLTLHQQQIIQQQLRQQHLLQQQRQLKLQQQMQFQQQQQHLCLGGKHVQEQHVVQQRYSMNAGAVVSTGANSRQYEHLIHQQAAQQQQHLQRVVASAHSHHHHHHHHNHHNHHSHHPHHSHHHHNHEQSGIQLQQQQQFIHHNHQAAAAHQQPKIHIQQQQTQQAAAVLNHHNNHHHLTANQQQQIYHHLQQQQLIEKYLPLYSTDSFAATRDN